MYGRGQAQYRAGLAAVGHQNRSGRRDTRKRLAGRPGEPGGNARLDFFTQQD